MEAKQISDIFQVNFRSIGNFYLVADFDTKPEILGTPLKYPQLIIYR
jgi:hypothetical protein